MKNPFQIENDDVAALRKDDLPRIMNRLLRLEARRCSISPSDVETSLRINDADGGIDARICSNTMENLWLPQGLSVWQFKAGSSVTAADILKEVKKPGVRQGLADGGTYCLVMSADFIPSKIASLKRWLDSAIAQVHPGAPHLLFTASLIADWATEHPIMLFSFQRPLDGIWPLDSWLKQHHQHNVPYQYDEVRADVMKDVQQRFASPSGSVHVRIQGASGVGKTRLALEIFRASQTEEEMVLYAPEPPKHDFFQWMTAHSSASATLVVDECLPAQAAHLSELAEMCGQRLHLVTVGSAEGLGNDVDIYVLPPLQDRTLMEVVETAVPTLSSEQVRWIVRVAKGYVKLAVVLAGKVAQGMMTAVDITKTYDVGKILKELLPEERSRRAMRGLALLQRVGWDGEVSIEGETIARFLGMSFQDMREAIGQTTRDGLVSKQGRYRYVTPELVALWLAAEEWHTRKQDVLDLLRELPAPEAKQALIKRLVQLAGLEEVAQTIESLLSSPDAFDSLAALNDERMARLFFDLAKGHGQAAFEVLERTLSVATHEQLVQFTQGRSAILRTLERLAWRKEIFARAARLLLRLAEAENQTWGNNATGVWTGLFLTYTGATEVPAWKRYPLLQEALQSNVTATKLLAIAALAKALSVSETGNSMEEMQDGHVPPKRWRPFTWEEEQMARRAALSLLDTVLSDPNEQIQDKARQVLFDSARGMVTRGLTEEIVSIFEKLEMHDDTQR